MRADRTDYFRDYAEKNREKRRAISAAYRARNAAKVAAYKKAYRAAHADDERKPAVRKPRPIKVAPKTIEAKAEAFQTLRERFAAYRAARSKGAE